MNSFPFSAGAEGEEVHQHADGTVSKTLHTPWVYVEPDGTAHLAEPHLLKINLIQLTDDEGTMVCCITPIGTPLLAHEFDSC